jgi:hypothetical protein
MYSVCGVFLHSITQRTILYKGYYRSSICAMVVVSYLNFDFFRYYSILKCYFLMF